MRRRRRQQQQKTWSQENANKAAHTQSLPPWDVRNERPPRPGRNSLGEMMQLFRDAPAGEPISLPRMNFLKELSDQPRCFYMFSVALVPLKMSTPVSQTVNLCKHPLRWLSSCRAQQRWTHKINKKFTIMSEDVSRMMTRLLLPHSSIYSFTIRKDENVTNWTFISVLCIFTNAGHFLFFTFLSFFVVSPKFQLLAVELNCQYRLCLCMYSSWLTDGRQAGRLCCDELLSVTSHTPLCCFLFVKGF